MWIAEIEPVFKIVIFVIGILDVQINVWLMEL